MPSIGYRGFAVAPITLRAPSRKLVVITVQINGCGNIRNGHAMRAPTVYGGATDGFKYIQPLQGCNPALQTHLTVAISRHVVGARIASPPTFCKLSLLPPLRPHSSREGDRPQTVEGVRRRWKELRKAPSKLHMLHMHHMPDTYQAYDVFFSFFELLRSFSANTAPRKTTFPVIPLSPSP